MDNLKYDGDDGERKTSADFIDDEDGGISKSLNVVMDNLDADLDDNEDEEKKSKSLEDLMNVDLDDEDEEREQKQQPNLHNKNQNSLKSFGEDMMGNPYVNFLRDCRLTFGCSGHELVQKAARRWHRMSQSQRWLYSPEVYRARYANLRDYSDSDLDLTSDSDSLMSMSDDEGSEEASMFFPTPSKRDAQNQGNGCPEVKKKPVCKPKRKPASCKPKPKKRGCKPKPKPRCPKRKKRACKPKPLCPKRKKRPCKPKPKYPKLKKRPCKPKPKPRCPKPKSKRC